jgi:hypothetical protein
VNDSKSDAGVVLVAVGSGLRRSKAVKAAEGGEESLRRLSSEAVVQWLAEVELEALGESLLRATLEAVEAGLGEPDEAGTWKSWALTALHERDALQSALAALERWLLLHGSPAKVAEPARRLGSAVGELDRRMAHRARWLGALNDARRAEHQRLDESRRAEAWWFGARVECDPLLAALAGTAEEHPHLNTCAECRADLKAVQTVHAPRLRHLGDDELWRFDVGLASDGERSVVEAHAARCPDCAQAVQVLEEGEAYIAEALGEPPGPGQARKKPLEDAPRARRREVLAERRGVRLSVVREPKRTKLLVERVSAQIVRAEVETGGAHPIAAVATPDGWEVELPSAYSGPARVRIFLKGQTAPLTLSISV